MKRISQKEKILKLLLKRKCVHMRDLNNVAYRYGARLADLRKQGYKIETRQIRAGEFVYEMIG